MLYIFTYVVYIIHTCAYARLREKIKVNFQIQIVGKVEIWMICAFLSSVNSSSVHLFHIIGAYILVSWMYLSIMLRFCDTPWRVVAEIQEWGLLMNKKDGFGEREFTYISKTAHP